jgi:hypothetical protein
MAHCFHNKQTNKQIPFFSLLQLTIMTLCRNEQRYDFLLWLAMLWCMFSLIHTTMGNSSIINTEQQQSYQYGIITEQIVNLRKEPVDWSLSPMGYQDPLEETQLLYQECIIMLDGAAVSNESDWVHVGAPYQTRYNVSTNSNVPYWGYIHRNQFTLLDMQNCPEYQLVVINNNVPLYRKDCTQYGGCLGSDVIMYLSIGTCLMSFNTANLSKEIIAVKLYGNELGETYPLTAGIYLGYVFSSDVSLFYDNINPNNADPRDPQTLQGLAVSAGMKMVGWRYANGARSSYNPGMVDNLTGVDNSGITSLLYLTISVRIPREVNSQYLFSNNITKAATDPFLPGDLLFLKKTGDSSMSLVMMYAGDWKVIESSAASGNSRLVSLFERLNIGSASSLTWGANVSTDYQLYWGRIISIPPVTQSFYGTVDLAVQITLYSITFGSIIMVCLGLVLRRLFFSSESLFRLFSSARKDEEETEFDFRRRPSIFNLFKRNYEDSEDELEEYKCTLEDQLRMREAEDKENEEQQQ